MLFLSVVFAKLIQFRGYSMFQTSSKINIISLFSGSYKEETLH